MAGRLEQWVVFWDWHLHMEMVLATSPLIFTGEVKLLVIYVSFSGLFLSLLHQEVSSVADGVVFPGGQ